MNILRLLKPKDTIVYVYKHNTIRQALEKLRNVSYTALPVIDKNGEYCGTVSEGDFLWHMLDKGIDGIKAQEKYRISDILRQEFNPPVQIDVSMNEVLEKAVNQNFIPVTDDSGVFIGIVTRQDIIRYFLNNKKT